MLINFILIRNLELLKLIYMLVICILMSRFPYSVIYSKQREVSISCLLLPILYHYCKLIYYIVFLVSNKTRRIYLLFMSISICPRSMHFMLRVSKGTVIDCSTGLLQQTLLYCVFSEQSAKRNGVKRKLRKKCTATSSAFMFVMYSCLFFV